MFSLWAILKVGICAREAVALLEKEGFVINKKKTVIDPVKKIRWLGKELQVVDDLVTIMAYEESILDVAVIDVLAVASRRKRCMEAVLGMMNWLGAEHRRSLPFLQTAYKWLLIRGRNARNILIWSVLGHLVSAIEQLQRITVLPTFFTLLIPIICEVKCLRTNLLCEV